MISSGPNIITNGLVLCLDARDAKSYHGEPTDNVLVDRNSGGGSWGGDGANQSIGTKGYIVIDDPDLMYNGYDTVLWVPGSSKNVYLNGTQNIPNSETSDEWTFSSYIKYEDSSPITSLSVYMYYPSGDGASAGTIYSVGDGWYRVSRTRTTGSAAASYLSLAGFTGFSANKRVYISGWQLERKQYVTPYVQTETGRSISSSFLNRSNNSYTTLTNITGSGVYTNQDGQVISPIDNSYLYFNGNNNYVVTSDNYLLSGSQTIEMWFMLNGSSGLRGILSNHDYTTFSNFGINQVTSDYLAPSIGYTDNTREYESKVTNTVFLQDVIYYVALVYELSSNKIIWYVNGEFDKEYTLSKTPQFTSKPFQLGRWSYNYDNYYFNGKIYRSVVYDRALSSKEILGNYRAMKGRFNL